MTPDRELEQKHNAAVANGLSQEARLLARRMKVTIDAPLPPVTLPDADEARATFLAATFDSTWMTRPRDECDAELAAFEAAVLRGVRERMEGLSRKAAEVVAGHRNTTAGCSECAMTWPCHAVLLARDIHLLALAAIDGTGTLSTPHPGTSVPSGDGS